MREDLDAWGNELNYYNVACMFAMSPFFYRGADNPDNTAYVLGQIPLMTLQTKAKMYVLLLPERYLSTNY